MSLQGTGTGLMIMGLSRVQRSPRCPVPAVPSCLLEPIWVEFRALLGAERPPFDPGHPLGCHRRRVPDRVVFEHVVAALVHGSGYERIASAGCSDRTIRRRLKNWAEQGIGQQVHALALAAYDQIIGLELADGGGWMHDQSAVRRPARWAPSRGPAQRRPETLGGHRRLRHPGSRPRSAHQDSSSAGQIRCAAGRASEPGQSGRHCQPQLVREGL